MHDHFAWLAPAEIPISQSHHIAMQHSAPYLDTKRFVSFPIEADP
jgi:hypothetical protein